MRPLCIVYFYHRFDPFQDSKNENTIVSLRSIIFQQILGFGVKSERERDISKIIFRTREENLLSLMDISPHKRGKF